MHVENLPEAEFDPRSKSTFLRFSIEAVHDRRQRLQGAKVRTAVESLDRDVFQKKPGGGSVSLDRVEAFIAGADEIDTVKHGGR
jgi:hypothetical protein